MTTQSPVNHLGFLDSIRGVAALYVVLHHGLFYFWPPWGTQLGNPIARTVVSTFYFGRYAVGVFIVLSGFCLMLPCRADGLKHGTGHFIRRRARRILPAYYFALVFSALFLWATNFQATGTLWDESINVTLGGTLAHLFLTQDWFGAVAFGQFNYVFWSVAVEWHIYFIFPALVFAFHRWKPAFVTFLVVIASTAAGYFLCQQPFQHLNLQFVGLFTLGMLAAWAAQTPEKLPIHAIWIFCIATGTLIIATTAALGWHSVQKNLPLTDLGGGIFTASLLLALTASPENRLRKILEWRPLVWVGSFSYSIYLLHAIVLHSVWLLSVKYLQLNLWPTIISVVIGSIPLVLVTSWIFHYFFERPFMSSVTNKASAISSPSMT